jgi:septum formation protein
VLILASASKARAALLRAAGVRFAVAPTGARELRGRGRTLREAALENARRKAAAAARRHPRDWVLAADTIIEFQGRLYGKPRGLREAVDVLARFAGNTHTLATGVVLRNGRRAVERVAVTRVTFKALDRAAVERIARRTGPTRFAGGYAIRRRGDPLVARVEGSFTNVVGLPMEVVLPLLKNVAY